MVARLSRRGAVADAWTAPGGGPLAVDTFNRADAATLGTSSSGHVWSEHGTAWSIASNRAHPPLLSPYTIVSLDAGDADVEIEVTVHPVADCDLGLAARCVDANNFIFLDVSRSGDHYVSRTFQRVSGSFSGLTSLVDPVTSIAVVTDPFTLRLAVNGSSGESWINDVSMGTWSSIDASLVTPTRHGLATGTTSNDNAFDDLTITAA